MCRRAKHIAAWSCADARPYSRLPRRVASGLGFTMGNLRRLAQC